MFLFCRCKNHRCIPTNNLCDGHDQCGDGSDEDKHICKRYGLCPPHQFTCKNGRCINETLKCDGANDCVDNSDEMSCQTSLCKWDTCSQICLEVIHNKTTMCKCYEGYVNTDEGPCQAKGAKAELVLAAEAELRLMSPYGDDDNKLRKTLATAPGYKVDAVDILFVDGQYVAYWTDHQNKRVQSMLLHIGKARRSDRDTEVAKTVLTNLQDPRGISLDWIAKRIYITDGNRILAASIEGRYTYTLVTGNMNQLRDIVVAPAKGVMFWSDWGPSPRIETAHMDGYRRKVLVKTGILWPTDLTVDHPANRLYWTDPKTMTIESIAYDGSDRQLVKRFEKGKNQLSVLVSFDLEWKF